MWHARAREKDGRVLGVYVGTSTKNVYSRPRLKTRTNCRTVGSQYIVRSIKNSNICRMQIRLKGKGADTKLI
jgi:hypothetical protein